MQVPVIAQVPLGRYAQAGADDLGVPVDAWAPEVMVDVCAWWTPSPEDIQGVQPQRRGRVLAYVVMVPQGTDCGDRDRWSLAGHVLEQQGAAVDYGHGPWGLRTPLLVYLATVEG